MISNLIHQHFGGVALPVERKSVSAAAIGLTLFVGGYSIFAWVLFRMAVWMIGLA